MPTRINDKLVSFASIAEPEAIAQAEQISRLPIIHGHVALMPDVHAGMGSAVGTVIPTKGAVIPAAVGVDIGCGMIAVRTNYTKDDLDGPSGNTTEQADAYFSLEALRDEIIRVIPMSAGGYNKSVARESAKFRVLALELLAEHTGVDLSHSPKWREQLGTLGSGNHFIELCLDQDDTVWLFLHSGSRGVGNKIAQKHIKVAQAQCAENGVELEHQDLAYLTEGTTEYDNYLTELHWAQTFALGNRDEMMDRFIEAFADELGVGVDSVEVERINTHHNYTNREEHFGAEVLLTRKGAVNAHEGARGVIPGSMGAKSYITTGKGNQDGLCSAPHGAGRVLSRTKARKTFTEADLEAAMGDIVYRKGAEFVDEHPNAYKPIDQVMADASELVEVTHTLRQIMNVKGH